MRLDRGSMCLSLLLLASYPADARQPAAAKPGDELAQLERQLDEAMLRGDREFVEPRIADDFLWVSADGEVKGKAQAMQRVVPKPPEMKFTITAEDVRAEVTGDTGVVSAWKTVSFEQEGKPRTQRFHSTNTWARGAGGWQLVSSAEGKEEPPFVAPDVAFDLTLDPGQIEGDPQATIVLVEYTDYQCPYCRQFDHETRSKIVEAYGSTGRVAMARRDFPLGIHPQAFDAARAAQCGARQGKYAAMSRRLFEGAIALQPADLEAHAKAAGLDTARFAQCMAAGETAEAVRATMAEGKRVGVSGTPAFLVAVRKPGSAEVKAVRIIKGAHPYEVFRATLDSVLAARSR